MEDPVYTDVSRVKCGHTRHQWLSTESLKALRLNKNKASGDFWKKRMCFHGESTQKAVCLFHIRKQLFLRSDKNYVG